MEPSAENPRSLPAARVFVVQVYAEVAVAQGQWAGRVEHVRSGQATHFDTVVDFLTFVARVLDDGTAEPPAETSAASA